MLLGRPWRSSLLQGAARFRRFGKRAPGSLTLLKKMIDRTWKIAITVGLTAALCAIVLSFFSGTNLHWNTGDRGGNFEIRVGIGNGFSTGLLGSIAIICLLLGAASSRPASNPNPPLT
jgi:hypothetical protein